MARTLYLMRHGLTLFNVLDRIQGWCDSPLVKLGVEQAKAAGEWLKERGVTFTHAYASPTMRAVDTCTLASGMTPKCERGLRELYFGTIEGGPCHLAAPLEPDQFHRYGGEDWPVAEKRICETLEDIMSRPGHECVFAVSHGRIGKLFKDHWAEYARMSFAEMTPNGGILVFEYDEATKTFSLVDAYLPERSQFVANPLSRIGYVY